MNIRAAILTDSFAIARNIKDISIIEFYASDSTGICMFVKNSAHSHGYILLCEHGVMQILWDKKYRATKVLKAEIESFIFRNNIDGSDKRQLRRTFRKVYKNRQKIYGKDGTDNAYRL